MGKKRKKKLWVGRGRSLAGGTQESLTLISQQSLINTYQVLNALAEMRVTKFTFNCSHETPHLPVKTPCRLGSPFPTSHPKVIDTNFVSAFSRCVNRGSEAQ